MIITVASVLAGCQTTQPRPAVGLPCGVGPFITDPGAGTRWTDNEKDQLLVLNGTGQTICGWRKPQ